MVLADRERLCGGPFPASVKEWFSIQHAEALFRQNTNQDELVSHTQLGEPSAYGEGFLHVASENQAVVDWYAHLDGSDNPPVYGTDDRWDADLSSVEWRLCSNTFSEFIFDAVFYHPFGGWDSGMHLSAKERLPDESMLERLRSTFQEGPVTDLPDRIIRRFFNRHAIIDIRTRSPELIAKGQAEWRVEADSEESLLDTTLAIWSMHDMSTSLAAMSATPESRRRGESVLKRIRRQAPGD